MADLRELYQEVIFDHYKRPRNFHRLPDADFCADGHNPLCGDRITVYLKLKDDVIDDVAFEGAGCAISTASASLMTEVLKGKTTADAERMFEGFHAMVTQPDPAEHPELGKLAVLSGVREFPARVKCATLCWHTLNAALHKQGVVTTE
ncbi:MAG: Fe-S cluster assembly sulfur transfer protein SufU [Burkholderiales bacterium]